MLKTEFCLWYAWGGLVCAALMRRPLWRYACSIYAPRPGKPTAVYIALLCANALTWPVQIVAFILGLIWGYAAGRIDRRR